IRLVDGEPAEEGAYTQRRSGCRSILGQTGVAVAGERSDRPLQRHLANPEITSIEDVKIVRAVEGQIQRDIQHGSGRWSAVAAIAAHAVPRVGVDNAVQGHFSHPGEVVGKENVARAIHCYALDIVKLGVDREPSIGGIGRRKTARDQRDRTGGSYLEYLVGRGYVEGAIACNLEIRDELLRK